MNNDASVYFPESYQESRNYFRDQIKHIKTSWPSARLRKHRVTEKENLTIDWIEAEPIKEKEKLILITTGLHGVEGFVGAGMLDLFIQEYLPSLDPKTTGLVFVHVINPWGMANRRRFNRNNVDLNRNFMRTEEEFSVEFNPDYIKLDPVLNPTHLLKRFWLEDPYFIINVIVNIIRFGIQTLRGAILLGQQSNPAGLYYAGKEYQPETIFMKDLLAKGLSRYSSVLHLDMHTGYGPAYQMSIVNSPSEKRDPQQLTEEFKYPLIVQADPEQFYSMQGDMIDWFYHFKETHFPDVNLYSAAFEFGTYGSGVIKETKSLRTMIYMNQADQIGSTSPQIDKLIQEEFFEMYFPSSNRWKEKALLDCRQALFGILSAEGYI